MSLSIDQINSDAKKFDPENPKDKVLAESPEPLHYADRVMQENLVRTFSKTPKNTVNSAIHYSLKDEPSLPYKKVEEGTFTLKDKYSEQKKQDHEADATDQIVSSFGVFWKREKVEWENHTNLKLYGVQWGDAEPVDFGQQIGLYLLYDRREVVHVGRAKTRESTLGRRLYKHTKDRLSARWDNFSWFGFLRVSEDGELGELQDRYDSASMIADIEAILIEAVEPRQNRKRRDNFLALEYIQKEDPSLKGKRALEEISHQLRTKK